MSTAINQSPFANATPPLTGHAGRMETYCGLAALALVLLSFITIGRSPFHDPDEFYYITGAKQMVLHGDWITPHFNNAPRVRKPVLFYWIVGGAFELFGIHVAVARLCSAFAAAVAIAGVWLIGRHLLGSRAGLLAALFAAGHLTVAQMIRYATTDTTLWAFCTLAQYGFIRIAFPIPDSPSTAEEPRARWAYLFFAGTALALLTKGPIALLWCFIPVLWPLLHGDWKTLRRLRWGRGLLIAIALVAPWAGPFIARNLHDFRSTLIDPGSHESYFQFGSLTLSPSNLLGIFVQLGPSILPWLTFIVCAAGDWRHARFASRTPCTRFLVFWLAVLLVLLTLAERKSFRYMLPPIAPTSLLLAGWLAAAFENKQMRWPLCKATGVYGWTMLLLAVPILIFIFATHGLDTRWLWLHVAIQLTAAAIFFIDWRNPLIHHIVPAILVCLIYTQGALLNLTIPPLTGQTIETLAPIVQRSLKPGEPLLLYNGLTAHYLNFMTDRTELEISYFPELLADLGSIKACLIKQVDWDKVPPAVRSRFTVAAQVSVERHRSSFSIDLSKDLEPAILVVRRPDAAATSH